MINEFTKQRNIPIGKIDILKSFTFFEVDSEYKDNILSSFQGTEWNGERVSVEVSKPPGGGSRNNDDRSSRGDDKRSFKKSSSTDRDKNFKSRSEKPKRKSKSSSSADKNSFKSRFSESKRKRR